ncbi:hypothetical protein Tco_0453027 [Tanacetum coccineum]
MFMTRIARSFGLLTNEMVSALNRKPLPHVYRKTSLVKMGVIMELHEGECCWPATREVVKEGKGDDEEGYGEGGNEGVGGSANIYHNMSQEPRDDVATIKRRRHDIHGDGVRDSATTSGYGQLKVDLEPFMLWTPGSGVQSVVGDGSGGDSGGDLTDAAVSTRVPRDKR